jgi:hypothetical protein
MPESRYYRRAAKWADGTTMSKRERTLVKLQPELVPGPLWGRSAYRKLGRGKEWRSIRQDALQASGSRCEACGVSTPPLFCHEKWDYNDRTGTATLVGFEILCDPCNWATHIGLAGVRGHSQEARAQLARVNHMTPEEVEALIERATGDWKRRSQMRWKVAVKHRLLGAYPQLRLFAATRRRE